MEPGGPQTGTLILDGKEVGPLTLGTAGVTLSSSEWLTERQLRLRLDTTCGPEDLKLQVKLSRELEAEKRKKAGLNNAEDIYLKAEEISTAIVYLDARSGAATDAMVGKQAVASSNKSVVRVGKCGEARKISIGGAVIGELAPPGKATLVDVPGGQCARLEAVNYAVSGMNVRTGETAQILKGSRTYEVPLEITYFFTPPPSSLENRGDFSVKLWSLSACP